MKYEMIFGEKLLFDGAPDDIVAVRLNNYQRISYGYLTKEKLDALSIMDLKAIPIVAMRRIIKEPRRWTWEDKKAGRLPEVGCDIQYIDSQKRVSVIAINSNEIVLLAKSNGSKFFVIDPDSLLQYYNPIETPAEKAQREEDEFIRSLAGTDIHYGTSTVKELFDQGARAAYRKLKGGE